MQYSVYVKLIGQHNGSETMWICCFCSCFVVMVVSFCIWIWDEKIQSWHANNKSCPCFSDFFRHKVTWTETITANQRSQW